MLLAYSARAKPALLLLGLLGLLFFDPCFLVL